MNVELLISLQDWSVYEIKCSYLGAIIFSISIFAGCIEGGSSAGDREKIASLELEITNLTAENEELSGNYAIIQQTLDAALIDLNSVSNQDVNNLTLTLLLSESHRDNLANTLNETMNELNRTQEEGLLAQLQGCKSSI